VGLSVSRQQPNSDLGLMREMADAVDQDRGHSNSLLTQMLREAADEIRELREEVERQQETFKRNLRLATKDLREEVERLNKAWEKDNLCGVCPYRKATQAENARLREEVERLKREIQRWKDGYDVAACRAFRRGEEIERLRQKTLADEELLQLQRGTNAELREGVERLREAHRNLAQRVQNLIEAVPAEWDGGDLGYLIGDLGDPVLEAEAVCSESPQEKKP